MNRTKYRIVYESKISKNDFIPTEEQFKEYEADITIETKEQDGCKIEFVIKDGELIGALMTDELCGYEDTKMDDDNCKAAYSDFNKWLNS